MRHFIFFSFLVIFAGCELKSAPKAPAGPPKNIPGAGRTDVLIYGGEGAWGDEIDSLKEILAAHGKTYSEFDDKKFNEATDAELDRFTLVVFPGGDSDLVTKNLSPETRGRIRRAVVERGLNYIGFCSGAWLAISPELPPSGPVYGFHLMSGPWLQHSSFHSMNLQYAVTNAIFPGGKRRKLLWFGGPVTPGVQGGVIAKYGDGQPAITQMKAGKGFVILSGLHPTATKKILTKISLFEKEAIDPELGWQLLNAGLLREPLEAFSE